MNYKLSRDIVILEGDENIEGIRLVMPMQEEVHISTGAFKSLPNLRLLQISNVNLTGSFENLFEELRWFCWNYSSLDCLPSSFQAPKLVFLDMQNSKVKILWEGTKQLQSLKILNASGSRFLKTTPDFKGLEILEKLILQRCPSLSSIHPSIGLLHTLVQLDLHGCDSLNQLPDQLGNMGCLRKLNASWSSIEQLPDSLGRLGKLEELNLCGCTKLRNLPNSVFDLTSLRSLNLGYCSNLESLPKNFETSIMQLPDSIGCLSTLKMSNLTNEYFNSLPSNLSQLVNLVRLYVPHCLSLQSLPELPPNLEELSADGCTSLDKLPNLSRMNNLKMLDFTNCTSLQSLPKFPPNFVSSRFAEFHTLHLANVRSLQSIQELPFNIKKLKLINCVSLLSLPELPLHLYYLKLSNCISLKSLPELPTVLRNLEVRKCTSLESLPELPLNLRNLYLNNCSCLESLPELPPYLDKLDLLNCTSLRSLPKLPCKLEGLQLIGCSNLRSLPKIRSNLGYLDLTDCSSLESLEELPCHLYSLNESDCKSLQKLPNLSNVTDPRRLILTDCSNLISSFLRDCSRFGGCDVYLPNLKDLSLINCTSLRSLPKLPCKLEYLDLTGCINLQSLPKFHSNLGYLDLSECSSLESLQELPRHLYYLNVSGCKSLQKLPDLSNLTILCTLILTDCSNLISNFIWSFLHDCSGLDGCDVYLPNRVIQDRFRHQRTGSSTSFQMPGEVKSNFLGMAFWVVFGGKLHSQIVAFITNKTDGTKFRYMGSVRTTGVHSWVRYMGKPISMKSGDRIEVSFRGTVDVTVEMCGVHFDCKRVRDVDVIEPPLCPFKRLKHSA